MKIRVRFAWSVLMAVWQAWETLVPVFPPKLPLMMAVVQLLFGSLVQPNRPGPSAPAGSVWQPVAFDVPVWSFSTWSRDGDGTLFGGYGGGWANRVPLPVARSHSQADNVMPTPLAADGGPHSAWAQACTVDPL